MVPALLLALFLASPAAEETPAEDPIAALIESGALLRAGSPVAAAYIANEGAGALPPDQEARAIEQLRRALQSQTSSVSLLIQGAAGSMNSSSMRQMREWAEKNAGAKGIAKGVAKGMLGIEPTSLPIDPDRAEQERLQAMVDPWVRAIAAAEALAAMGDAQSAGRFYLACLQFLDADWVPDACGEGILRLGPKRAEVLLTWMLENAESAAPMAGFGVLAEEPLDDTLADPGVARMRNAALEGLGGLVGGGDLQPEARERAFAALLRHGDGKQNRAWFRGAAEGLGRSRDPRAVAPLRRLAKQGDSPEVKQAALRGLAIGFGDEAAIRQLRSDLNDRDPEEQMRAAQALYEMGDEAAFRWAREVIVKRRTLGSDKPDIRAQVVRDLVELGGERARRTLAQALEEGPGNDWLEAWVAVGLLELGDHSQMQRIEAALSKEDWRLDPRGFRSIWRAIKPFLSAAITSAVTGGVAALSATQEAKRAVQLVGNLVSGERAIYGSKASQRTMLIAQLRWQAADAMADADPPGAKPLLERLLQDPAPAVRLSAARAFAGLDQPDALEGIEKAFGVDSGEEATSPRAAEVRATLLRAALIRDRQAPATRRLVRRAAEDPDPGVRIIGLTAARLSG